MFSVCQVVCAKAISVNSSEGILDMVLIYSVTRMWPDAKRDGRPDE